MAASRGYLLFYNIVSALLWLRILLTVITLYWYPQIYTSIEPWTRWTQTLAVLEVLHAATGKYLQTRESQPTS